MTDVLHTAGREESPSGLRRVMFSALVLLLTAAAGVYFVFHFVGQERERDLRGWQLRMSIVADSRFAAVDGWIDRQFRHMRDLAENASLQLYLTELTLIGASTGTDEPAERSYLRNLLVASAHAGGFSAAPRGPVLRANVARTGIAGIALLNNSGDVLVATPGMPVIDAALKAALVENRGKRTLYDLHLNAAGEPAMGFAAPIFAVQSNGGSNDQVGMVVGIKEVGAELFPLLIQPGVTETSAEAVLLRPDRGAVSYLSPLADDSPALHRSLGRDTPDLAAAAALDRPGSLVMARDYRGVEVLALSRPFATVPWTLMWKIDRAEALAGSDGRLSRMLTVLLLIVAAVSAALVAAWRHGTSRRALLAAMETRELARILESQRDFLGLITDSQPNAMAIIDGEGSFLWANRRLWENANLSREEVVGKPVAAVIGPLPGRKVMSTVREVLESGNIEVETYSEESAEGGRTYQSKFIPLPANDAMPARVLMASEDITHAVEERARRERIMRQLVTTLVNVVDRRDPYSANHSGWVADVAQAIATEMQLAPADVECVEVSGRLMNLGKILVPEELLTKTTPLSDDELKLIRESIGTSADLLEGIEFDGPVVETLRQLHAQSNGADPDSPFDGMLLTTRIVAVANTYVALVSSRAYRPGMSIDDALDNLLSKIGRDDSRRVVLALANYLDNRGGRDALAGVGDAPVP